MLLGFFLLPRTGWKVKIQTTFVLSILGRNGGEFSEGECGGAGSHPWGKQRQCFNPCCAFAGCSALCAKPTASVQAVRGKRLPEPQQLHFATQGSFRKLPSHVVTATGILSHPKSSCREIFQVLSVNGALSDIGFLIEALSQSWNLNSSLWSKKFELSLK